MRFLKKSYFRILGLGLFLFGFLIWWKGLWLFDPVLAPLYDLVTGQNQVKTEAQMEERLSYLPAHSYSDLEKRGYFKQQGITRTAYKHIYTSAVYYEISGRKRYQYIAGHVRFKDLLPKSRLIRNRITVPHPAYRHFLLVDKRILKKIIELVNELEKGGYDPSAFVLTSGFRPPVYNDLVKGKPKSRHLHGDAVDILVLDVNQDGKANKQDEKIVYELLDKKIIGQRGGLGTYKNSPRIIHFDMRGRRARWRY